MSKKTISNILLLVTAVIWGSAFVAQKAGTALEPFTYNGLRTIIGAVALIPVILFFSASQKNDAKIEAEKREERSALIKGGISCGVILFVASTLQQAGLTFGADAGKAGFITTLYIMIVPLLGLFLKQRVRPITWACIFMGAVGFYFLTMAGKSEGLSVGKGELFVLACAFVFSVHILVIDHFSPKCDGIKMSCIQFFVAGVLGIICMFIFEAPDIKEILRLWFPIIYAGVFSSGIAYTLQIVGQKHAEPATASLILSLESVFAVITGAIFLKETMTSFEMLGCAIIFVAVIVAQLPSKKVKE